MSNTDVKRPKDDDINYAAEQVWRSLKEAVDHYKESDSNLQFDDEKKQQFCNRFIELYSSVKNTHMDDTVSELDRHKVAAVIIVSTLDVGMISRKGFNFGRTFLGQEMISSEVAFEWMMIRFKRKLNEIGYDIENSFYHMPSAFACDTPYFDIFCRNIFIAKQSQKLNILDIAEKLFLIEYITLLKVDIDPQTLHGR